MAEENI